jgi:pimeloyl-ACP methyl ester carboxylesterase
MRLEAWSPQADALSATHRVIAVDMPGHGKSERLADQAQLPDFVAWFGVLLDDLNLERVNAAGHSMGALIAGGMAATMNARIARVALLNGVYKRSPEASAAVVARAELIRSGKFDIETPLERWFSTHERTGEAYKLTRSFLSKVDPRGYATAYGAFAKGDDVYAGDWPAVRCPALFLTGEYDANSSPAMAKAMASAAPNGRAFVVEGHRHMVNLTAPEIVNGQLKDWLSRSEVAA